VWKWLQIGTDMLLIITNTGDKIYKIVNINDIEWPWTPKMAEIDQDNLHMKFLSLSVDFSSPRLDPLRSMRPAHEGVEEG